MTDNIGTITGTLRRLDDLTQERGQLRAIVWERIIPFAARKEFCSYVDLDVAKQTPAELEAWLRKPEESIDFRMLNDFRKEPNPDVIFIEISVRSHRAYLDEGYIEVKVPAKLFLAPYDEFSVWLENKRREEHAAWEAVERAKHEAYQKAAETKRKRKEERERKQYALLKEKFNHSEPHVVSTERPNDLNDPAGRMHKLGTHGDD